MVATSLAKLSVIMPVYNERETIEEALRRVKAVPIEKEIVVVDLRDHIATGFVTRSSVEARVGDRVEAHRGF